MKKKNNIIFGTLFSIVLVGLLIFNGCQKSYNEVYAIDTQKCAACLECVAVCGQHAITVVGYNINGADSLVIDQNRCVGCMKCVQVCTYDAINPAD